MPVEVVFHAQKWNGEHVEPSPRDPNTASFTIPVTDAVVEESSVPESKEDIRAALPADNSYESDALAEHPDAPEWVRDWVDNSKGPFYIETRLVSE